jgi:hypothetical protein
MRTGFEERCSAAGSLEAPKCMGGSVWPAGGERLGRVPVDAYIPAYFRAYSLSAQIAVSPHRSLSCSR